MRGRANLIFATMKDPIKSHSVLTTPLPKSQRVGYLDILRGMAILFIYLANVQFFSGYYFLSETQMASYSTASLDRWLYELNFLLVDGKFYSIFSILSGIGFVVQYNKFRKNRGSFPAFFSRRMLGLLFIGSLHLFLFWLGDILAIYALVGLILILFRNTSNKNLLRWAAVLIVLPVLHWAAMYLTDSFYFIPIFAAFGRYGYSISPELFTNPAEGVYIINEISYLQMTSLSEWFQLNIGRSMIRLALVLQEGRFFKVLGLFLLGIWAGRQILDHDLLSNNRFLKKVLFWGFLVGLPMNILRTYINFNDLNDPIWTLASFMAYALGVVPLACGIAAGIALVVKKRPYLLSFFKPVGRTALSNYLFQSAISIFIYYGLGLNMVLAFSYSSILLLTISVFIFQILMSSIWLHYFRYGPMEWIWRQMTYGKILPLRKAAPQTAPAEVVQIR